MFHSFLAHQRSNQATQPHTLAFAEMEFAWGPFNMVDVSDYNMTEIQELLIVIIKPRSNSE